MGSFVALLMLIGGSVALFAWTGRRASPFHVTFLWLAVIGVGYFRMKGSSGSPSTVGAYVGCLVALAFGYAVATRPPAPVDGAAAHVDTAAEGVALRLVWVVFGILAIYHLVAIGIPILSANVDRVRYDFTGSGLFGLPGRALLFGIPLTVVTADAVRRRSPTTALQRTFVATLATLVVLRVMSGFKGDLLQVLVLFLVLQLTNHRSVNLGAVARRYGVYFLAGLAFALFISLSLRTVQNQLHHTGKSPVALLYDRMTSKAAEPGARVIRARSDGSLFTPRNTILSDARYYTTKYLSIGTSRGVPFELRVSAAISRRNPRGRLFLVPVTIGGLPELYYDFGWIAFAIAFLLGTLYATLERRATEALAVGRRVSSITGIIVLHYALIRGDLAFNLINWTAMLVAVLLVFRLGRALHPNRSTRAVESIARYA